MSLGDFLSGLFGGRAPADAPEAVRRHCEAYGGERKGESLLEASYVVFDMELTGLDMLHDSVISIGAVKMKGRSIYPMKSFHSLVKPESALKGESVVVHEITHTDLQGAEPLCQVLDRFLQYVDGAILVGYFVSIDKAFLARGMKQCYRTRLKAPCLDIISMHEWLRENDSRFIRHFKEPAKNDELVPMAKAYGVPLTKTHDAFEDAYVTAQLFQKFLSFLPERGVRTVGQLMDIAKI